MIDLLERLQEKIVQGTDGPTSRKFVVLYEDEYLEVLKIIKANKPKRRGRPPKSEHIPHEAQRA